MGERECEGVGSLGEGKVGETELVLFLSPTLPLSHSPTLSYFRFPVSLNIHLIKLPKGEIPAETPPAAMAAAPAGLHLIEGLRVESPR